MAEQDIINAANDTQVKTWTDAATFADEWNVPGIIRSMAARIRQDAEAITDLRSMVDAAEAKIRELRNVPTKSTHDPDVSKLETRIDGLHEQLCLIQRGLKQHLGPSVWVKHFNEVPWPDAPSQEPKEPSALWVQAVIANLMAAGCDDPETCAGACLKREPAVPVSVLRRLREECFASYSVRRYLDLLDELGEAIAAAGREVGK